MKEVTDKTFLIADSSETFKHFINEAKQHVISSNDLKRKYVGELRPEEDGGAFPILTTQGEPTLTQEEFDALTK